MKVRSASGRKRTLEEIFIRTYGKKSRKKAIRKGTEATDIDESEELKSIPKSMGCLLIGRKNKKEADFGICRNICWLTATMSSSHGKN